MDLNMAIVHYLKVFPDLIERRKGGDASRDVDDKPTAGKMQAIADRAGDAVS